MLRAARLGGDVAFKTALSRARAITPVPGVGPMAIVMLMANALRAAKLASTRTRLLMGCPRVDDVLLKVVGQ
ncbi:hypothetical protein [Methylovirgula ligni]|uniref:hypothetical protein n=1 Tax=Methylovirgula ligni TaxID=569860 RepID=UPI003CCB5364